MYMKVTIFNKFLPERAIFGVFMGNLKYFQISWNFVWYNYFPLGNFLAGEEHPDVYGAIIVAKSP